MACNILEIGNVSGKTTKFQARGEICQILHMEIERCYFLQERRRQQFCVLRIVCIVRQMGHCMGGNFNIHIWAWSASPSVQVGR